METHILNMGLTQLSSVLRKQFMKTSHPNMRTILAVTGIAIIISGCGASLKNSMVRPSVSPTSIVQVNQRLEIPNSKARVYIQDGIKAALREIDKWSTYCSLRMKDLHIDGEPNLTILPGQFEIIKVREFDDSLYFPGTFVVPRGISFDFPLDVIFEVEMRLNSTQQPDVWAMYCARQMTVFSPFFRPSYYPKLADISVALGNTVEIREP
jgi:hypothetical protein